jgi:rubrerythrin
MEDNNKALLDGLMQAIKGERDGYSFYMMASRGSDDPKGQEVFEQLAHEEMEHMHFLRQQYDSILRSGKPDLTIKLGSKTALSDMSPIFSDQIKSRIQDAHIEMSALSIGIQLELDAIKLYKSQAEAASDPDITNFYNELAEWESGHYHALLKQQEELKEDYWSSGGFSPF